MISKRKGIVLAASLALALALTGCGNGGDSATTPTAAPTEAVKEQEAVPTKSTAPDPTSEPTAEPVETNVPATDEGNKQFSANGDVIFEKDDLKITTKGCVNASDIGEARDAVLLQLENKGDRDAYLGIIDGSVNGIMTDIVFIRNVVDDEGESGISYDFSITLPAKSSEECYISYYDTGMDINGSEKLGSMEFTIALAPEEYSWYEYYSEPVVIVTGREIPEIDIKELGTVALENDDLLVVFGEQDYDGWFGPTLETYVLNKSNDYISLLAEGATLDGVNADYAYFGVVMAPGKMDVTSVSFEGPAKELKGFENINIDVSISRGGDRETLSAADYASLGTLKATYPKQVWGVYEAQGYSLEIKPKYNSLITVKTFEGSSGGELFSISETKSLEASGFSDGAGELISIWKVSKEKMHEMLCYDMSGVNVFAKDDEDNYFFAYTPTDVRYERKTTEELVRDADEWTMINTWASTVSADFSEQNGLEYAWFGNTIVDRYIAKAAYMDDIPVTLSTLGYGEVSARWLSGEPYGDFLLYSAFEEVDISELPDGEYAVICFPEEDVRLNFFFAEGAYVEVVSGNDRALYKSWYYDDNISYAEAVEGWCRAACEEAGLVDIYEDKEQFYGEFHEKIAGRGAMSIHSTLAADKVKIDVRWAGSAYTEGIWEIVASVEDGKLVYDHGTYSDVEYDSDGYSWVNESMTDLNGYLIMDDNGEIIWHEERSDYSADSTFIRN